MSTDCLFCQIIAGEAAGSFVYQDETVVAFMDINQPNPYKVLVLPRRHAPMFWDLSADEAAAVMQAARRIAQAIRDVSGCQAMNVFQANGAIAGQDVFHYHLHLLPRHPGDGHHSRQRQVKPREELDELAATLRAALSDL